MCSSPMFHPTGGICGLEKRAPRRRGPSPPDKARKMAMNWVFHQGREAGGTELKDVPSLGRLDLGRTDLERRLIGRLSEGQTITFDFLPVSTFFFALLFWRVACYSGFSNRHVPLLRDLPGGQAGLSPQPHCQGQLRRVAFWARPLKRNAHLPAVESGGRCGPGFGSSRAEP